MKGIKSKLKLKSFSILVAALCCLTAFSQNNRDAKILFHRGLHLEEVKGELEKAIAVFNQVVEQFSEERAITARALLHIGFCWEKLGKKEAQKAYLRILQEFKDQQEVATEAQARLATLAKPPASAAPKGMLAKRVWGHPLRRSESLSADGRYLIYRPFIGQNLYIHDLVSGKNRQLTNASYPWIPYFRNGIAHLSPDNKQMAYSVSFNRYEELRLIDLDGTEPRSLFRTKEGEKIWDIGGWSSDGQNISLTLMSANGINWQIAIVSVVDGSMVVLKTLDRIAVRLGRFSPDGDYLVYDFPPQEGSRQCDIFLLATDGSHEVPLVEHPSNDGVLDWTPEGDFLFSSDRTGTDSIWVIRLKDGRPQGDPELLKPDIGSIHPLGFTPKGSFYYSAWKTLSDVYIAPLDPQTGKSRSQPVAISKRFAGPNMWPVWSPDGKYLAYILHQRFHVSLGGLHTLMIRSLDTGEERMLSPKYSFVHPISICNWFPDGKSILASGPDWSRHGFFKIDVQTGGVTPIFWNSPGEVIRNPVLNPDGEEIYYLRWKGNNILTEAVEDPSIMALNIETGQEREIYRPDPANFFIRTFTLSPDGQKLAFYRPEWTQNDNERIDVLMVMPSDGGKPLELMKSQPRNKWIDHNAGLVWTPDGAHLLFWKYKDSLVDKTKLELWRVPAQGGIPEKLGLAMENVSCSSIHPDGKQIAFCSGSPVFETWVMENFLPKED